MYGYIQYNIDETFAYQYILLIMTKQHWYDINESFQMIFTGKTVFIKTSFSANSSSPNLPWSHYQIVCCELHDAAPIIWMVFFACVYSKVLEHDHKMLLMGIVFLHNKLSFFSTN